MNVSPNWRMPLKLVMPMEQAINYTYNIYLFDIAYLRYLNEFLKTDVRLKYKLNKIYY